MRQKFTKQVYALLAYSLSLGLQLHPEDGGRKFHRNVSKVLPDYTASYPRRLYSSSRTLITSLSYIAISLPSACIDL
jgi:hypothetical protein